ncbi:MAG: hypothetical protein MUC96_22595 [Myxococcaceae bacterium]|jgi:hypothetical protein|nr:hypothetical protein [Myxococcaceae bacterium]
MRRAALLTLALCALPATAAEPRRFGLQAELGTWVPANLDKAFPLQAAVGAEWRLPLGFVTSAQLGFVHRTLVSDGFVRVEGGWRKRWHSGVTFEAKVGLGLALSYTAGPLYGVTAGGDVGPVPNAGLLSGLGRVWLGPGYAWEQVSVMLGFFLQARGPRFEGVGLEPGVGLRLMVW